MASRHVQQAAIQQQMRSAADACQTCISACVVTSMPEQVRLGSSNEVGLPAGFFQVCTSPGHGWVGQLRHQQLSCQGHAQEAGHLWHSCNGMRCDRDQDCLAAFIAEMLQLC